MNRTLETPVEALVEMYESMLRDLSYDLHERYSHLLTGLLHQLEQQKGEWNGMSALVAHIIEDMRGNSNQTTPLSLYRKGPCTAFKGVCREMEKRFGVNISVTTQNCWSSISERLDHLFFRLLQITLHIIIEEADTDKIEINMDADGTQFIFQSDREYLPIKQKELLSVIEKRTGVERKIEREDTVWKWSYFAEKREIQ